MRTGGHSNHPGFAPTARTWLDSNCLWVIGSDRVARTGPSARTADGVQGPGTPRPAGHLTWNPLVHMACRAWPRSRAGGDRLERDARLDPDAHGRLRQRPLVSAAGPKR